MKVFYRGRGRYRRVVEIDAQLNVGKMLELFFWKLSWLRLGDMFFTNIFSDGWGDIWWLQRWSRFLYNFMKVFYCGRGCYRRVVEIEVWCDLSGLFWCYSDKFEAKKLRDFTMVLSGWKCWSPTTCLVTKAICASRHFNKNWIFLPIKPTNENVIRRQETHKQTSQY